MNEKQEQDEVFVDRFLNASFSFWNSLITLDSVIIGALAILLTFNPKICLSLVIAIFSFGVFAIVLIVWNFLVTKNVYGSILSLEERNKDVPTEKLDESFAKDINKALKKKKWVKIRENTSLVLSALGILFILVLIITEYK
jgi:hypothetical protein